MALRCAWPAAAFAVQLFAATDEAGLPDAVSPARLADIFAADIDFHRELRKGDTFNLVYEALTADGEPVAWNEGAGRVLAAEFVNAGRTHQAVWFVGGDGRGSYYGADGRSRKRAFLASPVEFSRVTSGFAMRMHPVLQRMRQHNGVDYGAPVGTPVRSVADGVVNLPARRTATARSSRCDTAKTAPRSMPT
jgi:murein DD-endopeptidase MepM/ murein hydrolase activator NlpD